jgi:hypothetical protein
MRKSTLICCVSLLAVAFGYAAFAQDSPNASAPAKTPDTPAHFYHLDFVVQEMGADGKSTNTRSYTATVSTDPRDQGTSIRTNSRIPIASGSYQKGSNGEELVNTQWQYQNVGVNIDARNAREMGRQLSLELVADISSIAASNDVSLHQPVIRQNKWQAGVLIAIGKATVVFTSDALDSKGSMQVVVTATALQ